ncbi:MAG: hypothetical protein MI757_13665 [Pirellulales bacterium]|nr:hypothetical protein [Pirellulales bacterium]
MQKTLDTKLAKIKADSSSREFILADAKDADMAFGIASPGASPEHHAAEGHFRSLQEYRDLIRENIRQGLVDIMLMSASTSDLLTIRERLFDDSAVTPAIRANDTSDIWLARGGVYTEQPSRPFRSASLDIAMCGKTDCDPDERSMGANLGLYSVTFSNDVATDHRVLDEYKKFREEAAAKGFRHFLELFDPNAPLAPIADVGRYMNDMTARTLAGVGADARPLFLKVVYHGPAAMEELASYDSGLVVGIMGGSSGTTFDAFHQLWEARKYGARAALYGRMINGAEHQLHFIRHLRALADGHVEPAEAVRSYHADLARENIRPHRALEDDMQSTARVGAYSGSGTATTPSTSTAGSGTSNTDEAEPDFANMSTAEKVEWNRARWSRILD